eukprot:1346628-Amorphochlora_amoeboformis.AAC.2
MQTRQRAPKAVIFVRAAMSDLLDNRGFGQGLREIKPVFLPFPRCPPDYMITPGISESSY